MKLPRIPELHIAVVDNGYIFKSVYSGESTFDEPYNKPLQVYKTEKEALDALEEWLIKVTKE